jgi:hypothetical protein
MVRPLVVYASSPAAIDFTALAMSTFHPLFQSRSKLALVKANASIAGTLRSRIFESRFSLPLPRLDLDPGRTLRQRFLPIDRVNTGRLRTAILEMASGYAESVFLGANQKLADLVIENGNALAEGAGRAFRPSEPPAVRGSLAALRGAHTVLNLESDVRAYESLFPSRVSFGEIHDVLLVLRNQIRALGLTEAILRKGGSLDLVTRTKDETVDRLRWLREEGESLVIRGARGYQLRSNTVTDTVSLLDGTRASDENEFRIVFRGPVDLLRILGRFQLGHIPWYCEICTPGEQALELISPVTVISQRRTQFHTDLPFRLKPSGHLLFDYEDQTVEAFISGFLGTKWTDPRSPSKQRFLEEFVDRYTSQNQIGSKSQTGMREFFDRTRRACLKRRPYGTLENIHTLLANPRIDDVFAAPWIFMAWHDVLDYLSQCLATRSNVTIDTAVQIGLRDRGVFDDRGLRAGILGDFLCESLLEYEYKLGAGGFATGAFSTIIQECVAIARKLRYVDYFSLKAERHSDESDHGVQWLQKLSRLAIEPAIIGGDHAVLCLNTVLSSNIFALALLLGARRTASCFARILDARGKDTFLMADPIVIEQPENGP